MVNINSRNLEQLSDRGVDQGDESGCGRVCFYGKKLGKYTFQNIYKDSLFHMSHKTA